MTPFERLCREEPWRRPRRMITEQRFNLLKARINALRPFLPHPHYQTSSGLISIGQFNIFQDAEHITMLPISRRGLPDLGKTIQLPTETTRKSIFYILDDVMKNDKANDEP